MSTGLIILSSIFVTSILSGVIGMAGGMILMAVFVSMLSVPTAMFVHGVVQATANGSRAWFLRTYIHWPILSSYLIGAVVAVSLFISFAFVPHPALILITIGVFPWLARLTPLIRGLDITDPKMAIVCGVIVTTAQLFAGVSGPLLDVFYLHTKLNKFQVVASKALTQTIGHAIKVGYYGLIIGVQDDIEGYLYILAVLTAVAGTRIGTRLLERLPEGKFRQASGALILTIGSICIVKGIFELL